MSHPRKRLLAVIGPGILVAATGVGAGDLATAAFTGAKLGVVVLWVVVVGAFFKYLLNEGLARWQLATGQTLLEGAMGRLGRPAQVIFLSYFFVWSYLVAAALMSACGAAAHAMAPIADDAPSGKILYGVLHGVAGLVLIRLGGFRLFEKVMGVCIAVMFVTVVSTAVLLRPDWTDVMRGILIPSIPDTGAAGEGLEWTMALLASVIRVSTWPSRTE
jgi:Mn2+/Fe2+ NRAMP family transporter